MLRVLAGEKFGNFLDAGVSAAAEAAHGLAPLLPQFPQRVRGRAQRWSEDNQLTAINFTLHLESIRKNYHCYDYHFYHHRHQYVYSVIV